MLSIARAYPYMLDISVNSPHSLSQPRRPANELAIKKLNLYRYIEIIVGRTVKIKMIMSETPTEERMYSMLTPIAFSESPTVPPTIGIILLIITLPVFVDKESALDARRL